MVEVAFLLGLGLAAGILSGLFGIGGGIIIIPALVLILGLSQHQAQGTTLALFIPPIGFLAAWSYYKQGDVNFKIAGLICIGFFFGGLIGAEAAKHMSGTLLKRAFGIIMILIAIKMILDR
ncbi:MAG: Sulfite exporter TauE/SafE [Syntrophorhabdaceae bacterium PtaU1.Bin034]|nr:MAG: Sulfite exporter TauE/SafE [Syntrophorhabdaceae bacterium PtaU1.Bin034]